MRDDLTAFAPGHVGDKTNATSGVLAAGVVQTLRGRQSILFHRMETGVQRHRRIGNTDNIDNVAGRQAAKRNWAPTDYMRFARLRSKGYDYTNKSPRFLALSMFEKRRQTAA